MIVDNLLLACLSCSSQHSKDRYIDPTIETDANNIPIYGNHYYFPMEFFAEEFLFAIDDANLQSDLDNNNIPEEFRRGFEKTIFYALRGSDLDSATVVTEKKGSKWLIVDERKDKLHFPTRKEEGRLKVYARMTESDTFRNACYSIYLLALREPLLFNKREDKEIYRFTWLRSFHNPVAIRIEKAHGKYRIVWKVCDGSGTFDGYSPGILVESKQREIKEQDWDKFIELLTETDFWNMPTRETHS